MSLLDPRNYYKPFEYDLMKYVTRMQSTYWVHTEVTFDADRKEFFALPSAERTALKYALLSASQAEVAIKPFWAKVGDLLPKPEVYNMGFSFSESEVRHGEAYSELLTVLGFEKEFKSFLELPVVRDRFKWLTKERPSDPQGIAKQLAIFSILMENVSLFSQFLIMISFRKHRGIMKNVANMVAWSAADETCHFEAGAALVNQLFKEYPEIRTPEFIEELMEIGRSGIDHEMAMLDLICSEGELPFMSREVIIEFLKDRVNNSFSAMDLPTIYPGLDTKLLEETDWFYLTINGTNHRDFFDVRLTEYSVNDVVFDKNSLF